MVAFRGKQSTQVATCEGEMVVSYHFTESLDYYHQSHHYFTRDQMLFSLGAHVALYEYNVGTLILPSSELHF